MGDRKGRGRWQAVRMEGVWDVGRGRGRGMGEREGQAGQWVRIGRREGGDRHKNKETGRRRWRRRHGRAFVGRTRCETI